MVQAPPPPKPPRPPRPTIIEVEERAPFSWRDCVLVVISLIVFCMIMTAMNTAVGSVMDFVDVCHAR